MASLKLICFLMLPRIPSLCCFGVVTRKTHLGLVPDREAEGDQVVEHKGVKVLLVASELAPAVDGITLDVQDTAEGQKLVVSKGK